MYRSNPVIIASVLCLPNEFMLARLYLYSLWKGRLNQSLPSIQSYFPRYVICPLLVMVACFCMLTPVPYFIATSLLYGGFCWIKGLQKSETEIVSQHRADFENEIGKAMRP